MLTRRAVLALLLLLALPARAERPADVGHHVGRHVVLPTAQGPARLRLVSVLGNGALSETYLARHDASGAHVAVKLQRAQHRDRGTSDGFDHEHWVLSRAQAPQLTRSHGIGQLEGMTARALVLELAQGRPLADQAWNKDWSAPSAVRVTMQILRGLRALHRAGIRHNDVHLGNVVLDGRRPESVKLLDVGHARPREQSMRGWKGATMAPERPEGATVPSHGRVNADVYAAAATLSILLTGKNPRADRAGVLAAIPEQHAGVNTLREVIARGLEADPARRYQTAQELIDALRPFSTGS